MSDYRGVLSRRRIAGLQLEDLVGGTIPFEATGSTSSYFLPKVFLLRKGFTLTEASSFESNVSPREIGYLFANG